MALVEEKKALLKELQEISRHIDTVGKRAKRLSIEFDCTEPADCSWVKDLDFEALADWLDGLAENCDETRDTMSQISAAVLNGTASRGDGSRS